MIRKSQNRWTGLPTWVACSARLAAIVSGLGGFVALRASSAAAAEFTPQALEFFEKEVRPLLAAKCFECHGKGKKLEGGLKLTGREGVLKGGESGLVVVSGKPKESPLINAVRYDGDVQMPPDGKLSVAEVASLVRWVELGVPWPDETDAAPDV